MEKLEFDYPLANRPVSKKAHVGVVGSGDMEVLMEPADKGIAHVSVVTSVRLSCRARATRALTSAAE